MAWNRLSHHIACLFIMLSMGASPICAATEYMVNGPNSIVPAPPEPPQGGFPIDFSAGAKLIVGIQGSLTTTVPIISFEGGGTITNEGTLMTGSNTPMIIGTTSVASITNSGTMHNPSGVISLRGFGDNNGNLTITNSGLIFGDIGFGASLNSTLELNGGTINGAISQYPSNFPGSVDININNTFTLGGTVNVYPPSSMAVVNQDTIFTANHSINGLSLLKTNVNTTMNLGAALTSTSLINQGTLNLNIGASLTGSLLINNGTLNLHGGTISPPTGGSGIVNINNNFTTNNTITGQTIRVNSPAVFNVNHSIISTPELKINEGATVNLSETLTNAALTNNGTLNLNVNAGIDQNFTGTGTLNVNANFTTASSINGGQTINVIHGKVFDIENPINYTSFVNNGTVDLNVGGTLSGGMNSTNTDSIFNINTQTTTNGAITNVGAINVNNIPFTIVHPVTGFNTLTLTDANASQLFLNAGGSLSSITAGTGVRLNSRSLTINSGSIKSNITGTAASSLILNTDFETEGNLTNIQTITLANPYTFTINQGNSVSGTGNYNNNGTTLISGGTLNAPAITNAGIVTLNAGILATSTITGGILNINGGSTGTISGTSTVNIGDDFTSSAPITSSATNVINQAIFTANNALNSGLLTVGATATMNLNALNTGDVLNNGILNLNPGSGIIGTLTNNELVSIGAGTSTIDLYNNNGTTLISGGTLNAPAITNAGIVTLNAGILATSTITGGILNINGGSTGTISGTSTVNIGDDFTSSAPITSSATNVINQAIFTANNALNSGLLTVGATATMNLNALNTGNVLNNGLLSLNPGSNITGTLTNNGQLPVGTSAPTITGAFVQNSGGVLSTTIGDRTVHGYITAGAPSSLAGTVQVNIVNAASIPTSALFTIVSAPAGLTVLNPLLNAPSSTLLTFSPYITPTSYQLIAERTLLSNPLFGSGLGVAGALEQIRASGTATPNQVTILNKLDTLSTADAVHLALLKLSPETNGGTLLCTQEINELAFLKITRGLHSMRAQNHYTERTGYSAGDIADGRGSYGPLGFVTNTTVKEKNGIPGFNALGTGIGFAGDIPVTGGGPFCGSPFLTKVGGGVTYAGTRLKNNPNVMDSNITSWQGILYGAVDYNLFFLDAVVGFATNHYLNTRHTFLGQNARGNFYGEQRTSLVNMGLNLPMGNLEVSPYFSVRNGRITQNQYIETGAPGENLSISRRTASIQQGGGGVKFFDVSQAEDFLPEVHLLFLTELRSPNLSSTAVFVEGSPSFLTVGTPLAKNSIVFGFSASGIVTPGLTVTLSYDLESRTNFWGNFGSIRVRCMF